MLKTFAVSTGDFEFGNRLVPSYYYYSTILKKENEKKGIRYCKLDEMTSRISDGEHSHIPRNKIGGIRYLYGRNIKEGTINFDPISDDSYITEENYQKFTRCHIKQNDILISIYGTIGKSAIYKEEYVREAGIPRHISSVTLKKSSRLTGEFITVFFRSKIGKRQLLNLTTGNIQQLLSLKNIRKIDLPIPDCDFIEEVTNNEKQAINFEIEALRLIEEAKQLFYNKLGIDFSQLSRRRSFSVDLSDIITPDLWTPSYSNPLYIEALNNITKKNNIVTLGEIASVKKGDEVGSDQYIEYINKKRTDIPFIRTSDIVNYEIDQFTDYFVPQEVYSELCQDVNSQDVIFTKDGKVGLTGLITNSDKAVFASGISRLRLYPKSKGFYITPEYLFIALSIRETGLYPCLRRTITASTIPHLREERLRNIELPIINPEDVKTMTDLVSKAFKLKDKRKLLAKEVTNQIDTYFESI